MQEGQYVKTTMTQQRITCVWLIIIIR